MCLACEARNARAKIGRRNVFKLAAGAALGLTMAPRAFAAPPKPENVLSPDAALHRLKQGNDRYVEGVALRHDFRHEREPLTSRLLKNPFA